METFVLKTLTRLRKETPRRFKDVRQTCDDLILALTEKGRANGGDSKETDADQYFEPLEMACQTRQPRLMEIALDAIHFLIEHGFLRGKKIIKADPAEGRGPMSFTDFIVETVSRCSDETDDGVQLQVIKVLLTAITSEHCEVHEASLLISVRACFHIHLISKNITNKTMAKAALTQIITLTHQRMEAEDLRMQRGDSLVQESPEASLARVEEVEEEEDADTSRDDEDEPVPNALSGKAAPAPGLVFRSVLHKDCYLLFRALCKLSMKGMSDDAAVTHNDAIPLQTPPAVRTPRIAPQRLT
ncbi:hypothetical protein B484DRAFT_471680 [Ochromonadaceae sp. CCMP2298]|nr:hypothetical protein B484DRAFT_471680 [Ochromonadaceae sp. CCMP2298]